MLSQDASISEIRAAARRLAGKVVHTPVKASAWLSSATGADVVLKLENLQVTGSFKYRGALNCLSVLAEQGQQKVVTASAGNHALGIAEATRLTEIEATIFVPKTVSSAKLEKLKRYSCELVLAGDDCLQTEELARAFGNREENCRYISPYNNADVIAGQGTVALELLQVLPDLDTLVVAVGGGGLISGVALAARSHNPKMRIVGVVAEHAPVMKRCVEAGSIIDVEETCTVADTIAGNIEKDSITFAIARSLVDEWVAVPERCIRQTMFDFLSHEGMLIEGSASAAVASVAYRIVPLNPREKVGVIVCGGNVAREVWQAVCRENL